MTRTLRGHIGKFKGFAMSGFGPPTSGGRSTINDDPVHTREQRARFTVLAGCAVASASVKRCKLLSCQCIIGAAQRPSGADRALAAPVRARKKTRVFTALRQG
jgi:hypothetical protein